ncbi:hypothetical protein [Parabacteroides goldsteinii]|jgi:hypothetical protein|uniref:hypothetical protein n=1 Tax=Parabacteroides goldsteinii TaxID=328812 RepID=UPI00189A0059|nr:hypothetical protein [Parabacteroides goldsteinii]DAU85857.1 MAG TPA: hypothetical protein [Caudoviricetes sp.]
MELKKGNFVLTIADKSELIVKILKDPVVSEFWPTTYKCISKEGVPYPLYENELRGIPLDSIFKRSLFLHDYYISMERFNKYQYIHQLQNAKILSDDFIEKLLWKE